jgi:hypothetical protein
LDRRRRRKRKLIKRDEEREIEFMSGIEDRRINDGNNNLVCGLLKGWFAPRMYLEVESGIEIKQDGK